jgi:surface antigen
MNRLWILGIAIALLPVPSIGQIGWGRITKGGPFQEFRDGDWEMFRQNVVRAAESAENENPITWTNAKTGAQGTVKVARRFTSQELGECRDLQGNTTARSRTGPFAVTLCRQPGGTWRIN